MDKTKELSYENGYLMGYQTGVICPEKQRISEKGIKMTQDKVSKMFGALFMKKINNSQ